MADEIINKVAKAQIEQIDLSDFISTEHILEIDLKGQLWNELVLKEKEFRDWVKEYDWDRHNNRITCVYCSNDAIIPAWAYMLVSSKLSNAKKIIFGNIEVAREELFFDNLNNWDISTLKNKRVMVKGCSDIPKPNKAFGVLTNRLQPVVKSLMFGEPCSAVPVFKN
jgi:hypothetical protein